MQLWELIRLLLGDNDSRLWRWWCYLLSHGQFRKTQHHNMCLCKASSPIHLWTQLSGDLGVMSVRLLPMKRRRKIEKIFSWWIDFWSLSLWRNSVWTFRYSSAWRVLDLENHFWTSLKFQWFDEVEKLMIWRFKCRQVDDCSKFCFDSLMNFCDLQPIVRDKF